MLDKPSSLSESQSRSIALVRQGQDPQDPQDPTARDKLFRNQRKFIWSVSNELARKHALDVDEAFQWASIAFLHSLESYDPLKGKLLTHSRIRITSRVLRQLLHDKSTVAPGPGVWGGVQSPSRSSRSATERHRADA